LWLNLLTAERLVANDEDAIAIAVTPWNFFGVISVAGAILPLFPLFLLAPP
jgi:hypothetical protein